MKINIKELEAAFLRVINYLEDKGIKKLVLRDDYYWVINKEECYDVSKKPDPKELTLGQLTWDIERARKMAKNEDEYDAIAYDLVFLSTLMLALGEEDTNNMQNDSSYDKIEDRDPKKFDDTWIYIDEIKIDFLKIMRHLREDGIREYNLKNSNYWYIPKEQLYELTTDPNLEDLKIGSFSKDIEKMNRIANDKEVVSGDFMWLSAIMRALGEEIFT